MTRHLQRAVNTCADGNTLIGSQMGSSPHLTLPYHPLRPSIDDSPSPHPILRLPVSISPPRSFSPSTPETQPPFAKYLSRYIRLYIYIYIIPRVKRARYARRLANTSPIDRIETKGRRRRRVDKEKERIKPRPISIGLPRI